MKTKEESESIGLKQKMREWIKRYLLPEILSFITTLIAAIVAYKLTRNQITTALSATWGGNITYFGYIFIRDVTHTRKKYQIIKIPYTGKDLLKNIRALVLEFGIAEIVDSFFIRPALMYYFPIWTGNLSLGIFLAKIAADITFYIPAIIGYELSKKYR